MKVEEMDGEDQIRAILGFQEGKPEMVDVASEMFLNITEVVICGRSGSGCRVKVSVTNQRIGGRRLYPRVYFPKFWFIFGHWIDLFGFIKRSIVSLNFNNYDNNKLKLV